MADSNKYATIYAWRKANPEKVREIKRRYYQSAKGKLSKKKEEAAYKESGGRAQAEKRRAEKPISPARKAAKIKWAKANQDYYTANRSLRRCLERNLSEFDSFVLLEAVSLARLREKMVGGKWHVDHIIPVSKGGTSVATNLQVVPAVWNRRKSNVHTERFFKTKEF
jgi:hypothetical protein